jgi:hypothetical protein
VSPVREKGEKNPTACITSQPRERVDEEKLAHSEEEPSLVEGSEQASNSEPPLVIIIRGSVIYFIHPVRGMARALRVHFQATVPGLKLKVVNP